MNKTVFVGAVAMLMACMGVAQGETPKKARRVWTNDDLAPAASAPAEKSEQAAAPVAKLQISENGEDYNRIRKEVNDELVSAARARDKTYEESLALVKKRLEAELDPFRVEVLKKIIANTEELRESNRRVLQQFAGPEAEKGAPADTSAAGVPEATGKDQKEL